jgi:hypothetical protein
MDEYASITFSYCYFRSVNRPEHSKSTSLQEQQKHLENATNERAYYNDMIASSQKISRDNNLHLGDVFSPTSGEVSLHFSFDFAQQVEQ